MVCSPDQTNAVRAAYGSIVQNTSLLLKFTSQQPDIPAQAVQPAPAHTNANAASSPNNRLPTAGQLTIGKSIYNSLANPNCRVGGNHFFACKDWRGWRLPQSHRGQRLLPVRRLN
jgi:hypothetical protein